jgi:hypothetical protein
VNYDVATTAGGGVAEDGMDAIPFGRCIKWPLALVSLADNLMLNDSPPPASREHFGCRLSSIKRMSTGKISFCVNL